MIKLTISAIILVLSMLLSGCGFDEARIKENSVEFVVAQKTNYILSSPKVKKEVKN